MAVAQHFSIPASPYDTSYESPGTGYWQPPSRCSTPMTQLPVPNDPPLAEDWETFRPIIVELYDTLNLPLPVVRQRMQDQYAFNATPKMFKDRLNKKWGIKKNYSDHDIAQYLADEALETIHGKPVRPERLKRHLKAKAVKDRVTKPSPTPKQASRCRPRADSLRSVTSETSESSSITASTKLADPTIAPTINNSALAIYSGSKAFVMLQSYLETRLFSVNHLEHFFGPVDMFPPDHIMTEGSDGIALLHPSLLNQNYARAMALLRNDRPQLAAALLGNASTALEHLVVVHHPAFPSCFLDAFVELKFEGQQSMSTYVSNLAVNTALTALGPDHPITVLCRFVQSTAKDEVQMEQLLFFCARFCQLFSKRLGRDHKISAYVNLKHFEKLLQLRRLDQAYTQFVDNVEPAFQELISSGKIPKNMRAACLCYLRRKAHLLSSVGDQHGAERALRKCVNFTMDWLAERKISVAGNPLMEECFRLIDEIAEFLFRNGHTEKGIDLHSFAIGLCAAVRGECEGKAIRMFSAQLARYKAANFGDRVRILCVRFPSCSIIVNDHDESDEDEDEEEVPRPTDHILRCSTCANGPDTQLWCEQHRLQDHVTPQDKVFVRLARECLEDLLKWFGMTD